MSDILNSKVFKISCRKYGIWLIFVAGVSAFPILWNITLDYLGDRNNLFAWRGVRLMDFLTCGFCLLGGAFCDRYNASKAPSAFITAISGLIAVVTIGLYTFIKYSYAAKDELDFFPNDEKLVMIIMGSYLSALLISLFMLRKTLGDEVVSNG